MAEMAEFKKEPAYARQAYELAQKDVKASRNEYFFRAPRFLCEFFMADKENDMPLFHCLFNVLVLGLLQLAITPWMFDTAWYWIACMSIVRIAGLATRFILGLHFASHRPLLKWKWLNTLYLEFVLSPLMGLPFGTYSNHHIVMHHKENNIHPWDLSSTMPYQRDNFLHFLFYWLRFEIGIWLELPYYMYKKGYYAMCGRTLLSLLLWWYVVYATYCIRPAFSLWLFLIPQFVVSFLLMFGNFSQHMFIHSQRYANDHNLTINLIDSPYNQLTFNDGYHILHHKYPTLHWTKLPGKFATFREFNLHRKYNAICFRHIDYFVMGVLVMVGAWKKLASYMIPITASQEAMSVKEKAQFLQSHLKPISSPRDVRMDPLFGFFKYLFNP